MAVKKKRGGKKLTAGKRSVKKRQPKRSPVKKKVRRESVKKPVAKKSRENIVGVVTHYFPRVKAAAVKLKAPLKLGDIVKIKGHTTDFTQAVNSLQIDRQPISTAKRGQEIGLLVDSRVRRKDVVCRA